MAAKKSATKKTANKKVLSKAKTPVNGQTGKKLSQFEAAMRVLVNAGEPMNCKAMVEAMAAQNLWQSPGGKTPAGTLYASILRDLAKGKDARFKKVERGQFALAGRTEARS